MEKIFIDTNVFLDMYRSNLQSDIKTIMKFLYQNKQYFITTEQSINEFTRNRNLVLKATLENFKKQSSIDKSSSTFLRSLHSYKKYEEMLEKFLEHREIVIDEVEEKIKSPDNDDIYLKFKKLCKPNNIIESTNNIIDAANRRKISGNPPKSNKYTCGDEIIWESLLSYECEYKDDLIIVSKDKTFIENQEFLSEEYRKKTTASLKIYQNILEAYQSVGVEISQKIIQAEENLKWTNIIITALSNLGGESSLTEIYNEAIDILYYNDCRKKLQNKDKEATIRGILQRFSSDFPNAYNGKKDLFHQVSEGIWALR